MAYCYQDDNFIYDEEYGRYAVEVANGDGWYDSDGMYHSLHKYDEYRDVLDEDGNIIRREPLY